jgi:hypothetical protein
LWLAVFIALNVAGLVGSRILDLGEGVVSEELISPYNIPGIWVRWDANYYLGIAGDGYINHPGSAGFFPLYPLLVYVLNRVIGVNIAVAGMIISNLSTLFSTLLLYKIARIVKDDHAFALRSVLAMLIFPSSFFYFALYAESLYLALTLLGVYLVMRNHPSFLGAGLALGFASLARPVGWLADTVMIVEFLRKRKFDLKGIFLLGVSGVISIIGILFYVYYLYLVLGTFSAIPDAQADWPRQWQIPIISYWDGLRTLVDIPLLYRNWFLYAMNVLDVFFATFAISVIVIAFLRARKNELPWSLVIYMIVAFLFYLSSENELPVPLWGMSRWVASLFPMYFVLANISENKKLQILYYVGSALFLLLLTVWWTSGRWVG